MIHARGNLSSSVQPDVWQMNDLVQRSTRRRINKCFWFDMFRGDRFGGRKVFGSEKWSVRGTRGLPAENFKLLRYWLTARDFVFPPRRKRKHFTGFEGRSFAIKCVLSAEMSHRRATRWRERRERKKKREKETIEKAMQITFIPLPPPWIIYVHPSTCFPYRLLLTTVRQSSYSKRITLRILTPSVKIFFSLILKKITR